MNKRAKTRTVTVGNVKIGSGHPVSIQSMTKTDTSDIDATVQQIHRLEEAGCELIRVAVKNKEDAAAISAIKEKINIPLIADIHFDFRLALEVIKRGADKIRINPGNVTKPEDIDKIINAATEKKVPIRLGINSGSLIDAATGNAASADVMVDSLRKYLEPFQRKDFNDIIISLKSSDVPMTVEVYRKMAEKCDYPFHLGITAAGLPDEGVVKSSVAIGALLLDGIGDTMRVSLTGNPVDEVIAAKRILAATGQRHFGPEIIACPTCGRCQIDLVPIVEELEKELSKLAIDRSPSTNKPIIIAVMGCEVNGPGEAKNADIGIAFGKGKGAIFHKGKIVKTVDVSEAVKELIKILESST